MFKNPAYDAGTIDHPIFGKLRYKVDYDPDIFWDRHGVAPGEQPLYGCGTIDFRRASDGLWIGAFWFDGRGELFVYDQTEFDEALDNCEPTISLYREKGLLDLPEDETDRETICEALSAAMDELLRDQASTLVEDTCREADLATYKGPCVVFIEGGPICGTGMTGSEAIGSAHFNTLEEPIYAMEKHRKIGKAYFAPATEALVYEANEPDFRPEDYVIEDGVAKLVSEARVSRRS